MIIYEEILREFQKEGVKYMLVGGIAFNLLGGNRSTQDMDILAEMSKENLEKIVNILVRQGYYVKQPVDPISITDEKIRKSWIEEKNMKAFNFYKRGKTYEEVDIIIESPVNYEAAEKDAKMITIGGFSLPVISIDNLIEMKRIAGRGKDLLDIKELRKIKELQED